MKCFFTLLTMVACCLAAFGDIAQHPDTEEGLQLPAATYSGITYHTKSANCTADIYIPQRYAAAKNGKGDAGTPYPVIVATGGIPENEGDISENNGDILKILKALPHGYSVIVPKYSGDSAADAIENVISLIKWIKEKGGQYRLDPGKIILWGYSQGGFIAAVAGCAGTYFQGFESEMEFFSPDSMAAAQKNEQALQKAAESFGIYSTGNATKVQAVIDIYGIFSIPEYSITPKMFITPQSPPFFMLYGKKDNIVPYQTADDFATSLRDVIGGRLVEYILLPDAVHGDKIFENPQLFSQIFVFLNRILF